ncbi:MAG: EamA family transporter [Bacteroidota bacterium]
MLDLTLSVLCSSFIFVVFKLFSVYKINTVLAIVTNYVMACTCGLLFYPHTISLSELSTQPWFSATVLLGTFFIVIFTVMAKSSQINGVGVTSVATKMSLVIPVLFAVLYYQDVLSFFQILGILLALAAVYLASSQQNIKLNKKHLWLPLMVFLGSGVIDTSIKFIQEGYLEDSEYPIFSSTVFGAAALSGFTFLGLTRLRQPIPFNLKSILGGIGLGVPNYFSIFFLLRALDSDSLNSSSIFTINNVAIVLFSTLLGIVLFKEHLGPKNWLGVALAIISIVLVALF